MIKNLQKIRLSWFIVSIVLHSNIIIYWFFYFVHIGLSAIICLNSTRLEML